MWTLHNFRNSHRGSASDHMRPRLARLGLSRLQEIARQNGKKGGRPKGSGNGRGNNVAQKDTQYGGISTKV